jgi:hypothetical protein
LKKVLTIIFLFFVIFAQSQTHLFRANNAFNYVPPPPPLGNALSFSGTNAEYVDCGTSSKLNLTSSITVELWIKPSRDMGVLGGWDRLVHRYFQTGYFFGGSGGNINALSIVLNNNQLIMVTPNNTVVVGEWQHIAFVVDDPGNMAYIYKNGNLVTSAPWTGTIPGNPSSQLTLSQSAESFGGAMDDVRIWNTVRTQDQIRANMNVELNGNEAGLVAYYTFNQGTADANNTAITTVIDKTANPSNGTLVSFTKNGSSSNFVIGKVPK